MLHTTEHLPPSGAAEGRLRRAGGLLGIVGAVGMVASAAVMYSTGADLFTAVEDRALGPYLAEAAEHRTTLSVHLAAWIGCAVTMALAITLAAASMPRSVLTVTARFAATAAAGAVLVFFPMMLGLVHGLPGHPELVPVAEAIGLAAVVADDVATALMVGVAAPLVVLAGRGRWAPAWLVRLAGACLVVAALSLVPVGGVVGAVAGLLVVVVGLGLMVCLGAVLLRAGVADPTADPADPADPAAPQTERVTA